MKFKIFALIILSALLVGCGTGVDELALPPPEPKEPTSTEHTHLFTVDEGFNIVGSHKFFGDEFNYIIYKIDENEQNFYFIVIVLKDNEVVQVLRQNSLDYVSFHNTSPSMWLIEADVNFDGENDILLHLGNFGTQGLARYACFLYSDTGFVENISFSEIANPVVDSENQVILSSWRNNAASHSYAVYKFIDGEFIMTEISENE